MSFGITIECWGKYACFSRPELKVERVSYDVMTPSAARGLLEAIYWHPGLRYVIDRIAVMAPIRFENIRRNEVKSKILGSKILLAAKSGEETNLVTSRDIQQRAAMVLKDVHYIIEAHFEMTDKANSSDNPGKFKDILRRRAEKGQCYHQPYFGCREFPANFRLVPQGVTIAPYPETRDLGFMLYDMDYRDPENISPQFFHARLDSGVMDLRNCEVYQ